jgi:ABC-type transport system substrate-binding protein
MRSIRANSIYIFILSFFAILISGLIGFESLNNGVISSSINGFFENKEIDKETLNIIYPNEFEELNPLSFNSVNRSIITNVFEPLVQFDEFLQIKSVLAESFGLLDDKLTWEFKLRSDAVFSNGEQFSSQDVFDVFDSIKRSRTTDLKPFLSNIEKIDIVDARTIKFVLKEKDPVFLSKLTTILIFKRQNEKFIGSASYVVKHFDSKKVELESVANKVVNFKKVIFSSIQDDQEIFKFLKSNKSVIVVNLSVNYPQELITENDVNIITMPALETYFLGFDTQNSIFKNLELREAVSLAFDRNKIEVLGGGLIKSSSQFVNSGVLGFNPRIEMQKQDFELAKMKFSQVEPFKRLKIRLDLTRNFEVLGEYIKEELDKIGFDVELQFSDQLSLLSKIANAESEFYLLGWKYELFDVSEFLINMVHSKNDFYGNYNPSYYFNKNIDKLIETSQQTLDLTLRIRVLQEIMRNITEDDVFGVPLFNTQVLYGYSKNLKFEPRLDGYVMVRELRIKN